MKNSAYGQVSDNYCVTPLKELCVSVGIQIGPYGQLFYSTQIPACLWFLAKDKSGGNCKTFNRDRRGKALFIDARKLGTMRDRTHAELNDEAIACVVSIYHSWRTGGPHSSSYGKNG
jgi:type I restriction-modification system DNA methylase subunit